MPSTLLLPFPHRATNMYKIILAALAIGLMTMTTPASAETYWVCAAHNKDLSLTQVIKYQIKGKWLYDISSAEFSRVFGEISAQEWSDELETSKYLIVDDRPDGLIAVKTAIGTTSKNIHQVWTDVVVIDKSSGHFRHLSFQEAEFDEVGLAHDISQRGDCTSLEGPPQPTRPH